MATHALRDVMSHYRQGDTHALESFAKVSAVETLNVHWMMSPPVTKLTVPYHKPTFSDPFF